MRFPVLLLLCALFVTSNAPAQIKQSSKNDTLYLAGIEMKLGMPQSVVMGELLKRYDVKRLGDLDFYSISERENSNQSFQQYIGNVEFKNGSLKSATKEWYSEGTGKGYDLAVALHSVLEQMERRQVMIEEIQTSTITEPDKSIRQIWLTFDAGRRIVNIFCFDDPKKSYKQVTISESITIPKQFQK